MMFCGWLRHGSAHCAFLCLAIKKDFLEESSGFQDPE
jgi:hypothetical protein